MTRLFFIIDKKDCSLSLSLSVFFLWNIKHHEISVFSFIRKKICILVKYPYYYLLSSWTSNMATLLNENKYSSTDNTSHVNIKRHAKDIQIVLDDVEKKASPTAVQKMIDSIGDTAKKVFKSGGDA